ncbi:MAG: hypothetical protein PUB26_03515 [Mycoplasmataceae bacterium]|nr:hypothetical protein [Mycoplasmataceae bacterium]
MSSVVFNLVINNIGINPFNSYSLLTTVDFNGLDKVMSYSLNMFNECIRLKNIYVKANLVDEIFVQL